MIKRKILLIVDERLVARDIATQLRILGHEPIGLTQNGDQAIEIAGELRPGLVVMDVHMAAPWP